MILGDICTRNCSFCAVSNGEPPELDPDEPKHVAEAVNTLKLIYAVITSVTRDDLADGGALVFASVIKQIRRLRSQCKIEVLIPDFNGSQSALKIVLDVLPDVLNHNIETVSRLYPAVRPQAGYQRSLLVLETAKTHGITTKSGLMVGIGETFDEVIGAMKDLRRVQCDILTIGQYLQPTKQHREIARFVHPDEFTELAFIGKTMGFRHVESGPLVRSSYHADAQAGIV
jgi:lipoic acid synthetase